MKSTSTLSTPSAPRTPSTPGTVTARQRSVVDINHIVSSRSAAYQSPFTFHLSPLSSRGTKAAPTPHMSSKAISLALLFLCFWSRAFAAEVAGFIQPAADHPLKVKVVVLAMFENGADTGDAPGEYQFWVERRKMDYVIPLPAAFHDVLPDHLC